MSLVLGGGGGDDDGLGLAILEDWWRWTALERAKPGQVQGLVSTESHDTPQLHNEPDAFVNHLLVD